MMCIGQATSVPLLLAILAPLVSGHGHMAWPRARNAPENGISAGGPGTVVAFEGGAQTIYQHGICGNAVGTPQTYNRVGDIQATFTSGTVAEINVTITAHHVGFFELELCTDAGKLSEACFAEHRLLKHGCSCPCSSDPSRACPECDECRRWWKPLVKGELSQVVTRGYAGPELVGQGNTVAYRFTMLYVIPAGIKTSRGVLRWHYMTTNSCTSPTSSPEEFWNCADIAVADAQGDTGGVVAFNNEALEALSVANLMPQILASTQVLAGVNYACPKNSMGEMLGVGSAREYDGICGTDSEYCVRINGGTVNGSSSICAPPLPESGYLCYEQCSVWFYACANGFAVMKSMPLGTRCFNNNSVLSSQCVSTVIPSTIRSSTVAASTLERTTAPTSTSKTAAAPESTTSQTTALPETTGAFPTAAANPCSTCGSSCHMVCEIECGEFWWQCWAGGSARHPVPAGTKCKANTFVSEASCMFRADGVADTGDADFHVSAALNRFLPVSVTILAAAGLIQMAQ